MDSIHPVMQLYQNYIKFRDQSLTAEIEARKLYKLLSDELDKLSYEDEIKIALPVPDSNKVIVFKKKRIEWIVRTEEITLG